MVVRQRGARSPEKPVPLRPVRHPVTGGYGALPHDPGVSPKHHFYADILDPMATPIVTVAQMEGPLRSDRTRLEADLLCHLAEHRPRLFDAYPRSYLEWVVHDTVDLAAPFRLDEVHALRVFLQLRFDIAPGFFRQPEIAAVLGRHRLPAMRRWERLADPSYGDAWVAARQFAGAKEWRAHYWGVAA